MEKQNKFLVVFNTEGNWEVMDQTGRVIKKGFTLQGATNYKQHLINIKLYYNTDE